MPSLSRFPAANVTPITIALLFQKFSPGPRPDPQPIRDGIKKISKNSTAAASRIA